MIRALFLFLFTLCATSPAVLGDTTSPWTLDDILLVEEARALELSPDASAAVWVKQQMNKEKGRRVSNLMLTRLDDGKDSEVREIPLTRGDHNHGGPRFSPDGKLIAFSSDRPRPGGGDASKGGQGKPAKNQLWLMRTDGGEPWPLTQLTRSPRQHAWMDASTLIFVAQEEPSRLEATRKKGEDTAQAVEDLLEPPVRLFQVAVEGGKVRRLSTNNDWINRLWLSPNGELAVTRHQQSLSYQFDQKVPPTFQLTELNTGESKPILGGRELTPSDIVWQLDSDGFFVVSDFSTHPFYRTATVNQLHHHDLRTGTTTQIDLDWSRDLGLNPGVRALPDGGFLALLADGVRYQPARYQRSGKEWKRRPLTGEHVNHLFNWQVSHDGETVIYEHSTPTVSKQWFRASLEGAGLADPEQLTHLNPSYENKPKARSEVLRWTGALDEEVEGILYYPLDYREGERYPLVLVIHGGPAGADFDAWDQSWATPKMLMAQKGAFQLEVNYHGSGNYGLEWVESIEKRYYQLEIPDLLAGVELLIERGLADPDRLGTMGWSNGGILSAELITRDPRFKAASVGAADVEWISDWGNVDFGASFDNYYFGTSPLEDPQLYIDISPFFRLGDVETPTIVHTGTEDRAVPPSQSWSLFRALQQIGKVPVRLMLYPGEPHGLGKYAHQKRKAEEDLAWFDRHLFGNTEATSTSLNPESPLAHALGLRQASSVDGRYGVEENGSLVPEIVPFKELRVARFEVTRAQFAAFDPSYPVSPINANHPANGITFEKARSYASWLARQTGKQFRLPSAEEGKKLYGKAKGNTLDHWAGYSSNPEDARALLQEAAQLGPGGLLKPVGSFSGQGSESQVYDLGGNVAEWVSTETGGQSRGGSADRPTDAKSQSNDATPAYQGFRVVLEPSAEK